MKFVDYITPLGYKPPTPEERTRLDALVVEIQALIKKLDIKILT